MAQTSNRFFDEVARLMNDAAGVAQGVRREFDTLVKTQTERWVRDLDLVKREEFEAVKDMARLARRGERGAEGAHRGAGGEARPRQPEPADPAADAGAVPGNCVAPRRRPGHFRPSPAYSVITRESGRSSNQRTRFLVLVMDNP